MKILEQTREGVVVKTKIEVPEEELNQHFEKAYQDYRKDLDIDGFRKGKVPLEMVRKRFGEGIRWNAIDGIIKEVYPKVLEETGLRPVTPGDIIDPSYQPGQPLQFTVVVEVFPDFKVDNWKGLRITREKVLITDTDVNEYIETLERSKAIISERPEDAGAEMGDRLTLDLQELDSAGVIVVGHKREDIAIEIGNDSLGEGTDEQILGIKKGESRRLKSKRPKTDQQGNETFEDFGWEVTVRKVEQVELPEINDEFASQIDPELSTLDGLKDKARRNLENYAKNLVSQRVANRLIDRVIEVHPFSVPPSLHAETLERMIERHKQQSNNLISDDDLRKNLAEVADKQLRWHFIKDRLIDDLDLKATAEEVEKQLELRAGGDQDDLKNLKLMFASGERLEMLEQEIVDSKLMETLMNAAEMDDRPVDLKAMM